MRPDEESLQVDEPGRILLEGIDEGGGWDDVRFVCGMFNGDGTWGRGGSMDMSNNSPTPASPSCLTQVRRTGTPANVQSRLGYCSRHDNMSIQAK